MSSVDVWIERADCAPDRGQRLTHIKRALGNRAFEPEPLSRRRHRLAKKTQTTQTTVPYAFLLMSTGFIEISLIMLPLGIFGTAQGDSVSDRVTVHCLLLLYYFLICCLFLGADEVANQLMVSE